MFELTTACYGDRLRSERLRLGFSQEKFGTLAGIEKNTQSNYERGKRSPDVVYLCQIALVGADVQYIVTGQRLTPAEKELLLLFRTLTSSQQQALILLLTSLLPFA